MSMIAENLSFLAGDSIIGRCGGRNSFLHEINVGIHSNLVKALVLQREISDVT
jgi:hypothetical protein